MNNDIHAGIFGDWRLGIEHKFISESDREISSIEKMKIAQQIEDSKKLRDEERSKQYAVNADAVSQIWDNATPADSEHHYLKAKGIQSHGARVTGDGRLVLPLFTPEGTLASLQYIGEDGKRFHQGGKSGGCFWGIGNLESEIIYITEGFADACTIVEETGSGCFIAYSGSNMDKIAPTIKEVVSNEKNKEIIIISDNDEHGKGQEFAKKAANTIGSSVIIPPELGDINDYRANGGDVKELLSQNDSEISSWLIPADEFCSQPAPIKWLVKGWVQEQALCMVHGPSGSGKTFLVLDMALRIASESEDWYGHKVKQGNVFYLAGEGHHGLRSRLAGWKQENQADSMSFWVSKSGLDLDRANGYNKATKAIKSVRKKPDLIIVDTLHRFLSGDENSAQDAKVMLDSCASLMLEFNCTVFLVHHTGVSELAKERARGSSAWRGALDIEISVQPQNKKDLKPMEVKQVKSKDAELQASKFFTLDSLVIDNWYDEDNEPVKTAILREAQEPKKEDNDVKLKTHLKIIESVWKNSDRKKIDGKPAFDRRDIIKFLVESGKSEESAKQETKPSQTGRLINNLLKENKINKKGEQYIIVDKTLLSIFSLLG